MRSYLAREFAGLRITDRGRDVVSTLAGLGFLAVWLLGLSLAAAVVGPF